MNNTYTIIEFSFVVIFKSLKSSTCYQLRSFDQVIKKLRLEVKLLAASIRPACKESR